MKTPALVFLLIATSLSARTWTDVRGRSIEAEIVRVEGESVIVKRNGAEVPIKLKLLSDDDKEYVEEWQENPEAEKETPAAPAPKSETSAPETPAAQAPARTVTLDGKPIETGGKMNLIEKPYSPEMLKKLSKRKGKRGGTGDSSPDSNNDNAASETALKLAVAVPGNFNPASPFNVFIVVTAVNNEAERAGGNIAKFGMYSGSCVENGWVCIAVDSDKGVPSSFSTYDEAFNLLEKSWPGISTSNFAVGGFSGGAKGCWGPASWLLKHKQNVVGAFMGGCNQDFSQKYRSELGVSSSSGYRKIRAFMSTGKADTIASPAQAEGVMKSLKANGVRNIRSELHEGGHSFDKSHFVNALNWFAEPQK